MSRSEQETAKIARLADATMAVVRRAGRWLRYEKGRIEEEDIEQKGHGDLVSRVDREVDSMLRDDLVNLIPGAGVLSEEGGEVEGEGRFRWIVDPLDGSNNYLAGLPYWAVSVALEERSKDGWGDLLIGVVYLPELDHMYLARQGFGAKMNDHPIEIRSRENARSAVSHWWPLDQGEEMDGMLQVVKRLHSNVASVRNIGCPSAELALVADGTLQGFFARDMGPWDLAAGLLILEEAGGVISDPWGGNPLDSGVPVAGTEQTAQLIRSEMQSRFPNPPKG